MAKQLPENGDCVALVSFYLDNHRPIEAGAAYTVVRLLQKLGPGTFTMDQTLDALNKGGVPKFLDGVTTAAFLRYLSDGGDLPYDLATDSFTVTQAFIDKAVALRPFTKDIALGMVAAMMKNPAVVVPPIHRN